MALQITPNPRSAGNLSITANSRASMRAVVVLGVVTSVFGRTGAVAAQTGDYAVGQVTGAAPLASPPLTGTPTAPTASVSTNTTQIATTAFVLANSGGTPASATPLMDGSGAVGVATKYAREDHVHPTDTGRQAADAQLFSNVPQNSKSADYTLVLTDGQKHIYHPSADTSARTWTIPANASVAYPIGTMLTFINDSSAGVITIAITSDTLVLAGAGTTGSRSLAANGQATAIKMTSTRWQISGAGLT